MPTLTINITREQDLELARIANRSRCSKSQLGDLAVKQLLITCRDSVPLLPPIDLKKVPSVPFNYEDPRSYKLDEY